jgi:hypothetical protein
MESRRAMDEDVFFRTKNDPSDLNSFERFRLVDPDSEFSYILLETIIPNWTRSGASITRNARRLEIANFLRSGDVSRAAKDGLAQFIKARNAGGS